MSACSTCKRRGYCAPDCSIAPWNLEPASYPASGFVYLLRQRRWVGRPVERSETRFWYPVLEQERSRPW